jgi:hypothetical protein
MLVGDPTVSITGVAEPPAAAVPDGLRFAAPKSFDNPTPRVCRPFQASEHPRVCARE